MGNNGMALVRGSDRGAAASNKLATAINTFIPREMREMMSASNFLRLAGQQLEGADFRPETLYPALITFAMAGIMPNKAIGHGFLIPFKGIVTPVFGYKGLQELARRAAPPTGQRLLDVRTDVVLEGDEWDPGSGYEQATARHRRQADRDPRTGLDRMVGAYASFRYAMPLGSGVHEYTVVEWMEAGEVLASRAASAAVRNNKQGSPWLTWPLRMAQRVPLLRACASQRVPLGFFAGSAGAGYAAMSAQSQADAGALRDYLETLRIASEGPAAELLEAALPAMEETPEPSPAAKYEAASAPIIELMADPHCTLAAARGYHAQLTTLLADHGLISDERADALLAGIKREFDNAR